MWTDALAMFPKILLRANGMLVVLMPLTSARVATCLNRLPHVACVAMCVNRLPHILVQAGILRLAYVISGSLKP